MNSPADDHPDRLMKARDPDAPMFLSCPFCGHRLRLAYRHLGLKGNCVSCQSEIIGIETSAGEFQAIPANRENDVAETHHPAPEPIVPKNPSVTPGLTVEEEDQQATNSNQAEAPGTDSAGSKWGFSEAVTSGENLQTEPAVESGNTDRDESLPETTSELLNSSSTNSLPPETDSNRKEPPIIEANDSSGDIPPSESSGAVPSPFFPKDDPDQTVDNRLEAQAGVNPFETPASPAKSFMDPTDSGSSSGMFPSTCQFSGGEETPNSAAFSSPMKSPFEDNIDDVNESTSSLLSYLSEPPLTNQAGPSPCPNQNRNFQSEPDTSEPDPIDFASIKLKKSVPAANRLSTPLRMAMLLGVSFLIGFGSFLCTSDHKKRELRQKLSEWLEPGAVLLERFQSNKKVPGMPAESIKIAPDSAEATDISPPS